MGDFGFGGFDFGDIGSFLEGLLSQLISVLEYIWDVLVAIAQYLYAIIVEIAQALVQFFVAAEQLVVHLFETLYTDVIKPIIDEIVKIEAWISRTLAPVVRFVQRLQAWYNKYILPYQKQVLAIIQKIRQILLIFRLFGAKWAQKLDADLAKIQSYITTSIIDVLSTLNLITSWLQLISDPTQILRKPFWQNTAYSGAVDIYKAANLGGMKPLSAADKAQGQANLSLMDPKSPPVTANGDGTVTLSLTMADIKAKMLAALPDYNPTVTGYTGPVQA